MEQPKTLAELRAIQRPLTDLEMKVNAEWWVPSEYLRQVEECYEQFPVLLSWITRAVNSMQLALDLTNFHTCTARPHEACAQCEMEKLLTQLADREERERNST